MHSLVDDHSRLAYSEILPDELGVTCTAFLERAIGYFAVRGNARIERLMTDNAWAYRYSLREICAAHGIGRGTVALSVQVLARQEILLCDTSVRPHIDLSRYDWNEADSFCGPIGPTGAKILRRLCLAMAQRNSADLCASTLGGGASGGSARATVRRTSSGLRGDQGGSRSTRSV